MILYQLLAVDLKLLPHPRSPLVLLDDTPPHPAANITFLKHHFEYALCLLETLQ